MSQTASNRAAVYAKAGFVISTDPQLLDLDMIHRYLSESSYWSPGIAREIVERSLRNSFCFGLYAQQTDPIQQVGFARTVTDFATFAYLSDVFILPQHQGQGLGKWLVATMLEHPELRTVRRWTLYTRDAHELYRQFGFDAEQDPQRYMCYRPQPLDSSSPGIERR